MPETRTQVTEKIAILVVGMHRSGTSALARTISLLGARLPSDLVGPNEGNPHGHWEPQLIVDLNDKMLADAGSDVYSIIDFSENWFMSPRVKDFTAQAVKILQASFGDDPFIVIKDPRVALLLPIWHQALAELNYRCVHVLPVRHPDVVADSLRRRHLKSIPYDAWKDPRGQAVWLRYTIAAILKTRQSTRCFINYSSLIADWRSTTNQIAADLGIVWPRTGPAVEREIDAFLHKNELADAQHTSEPPHADRIDDMPLTAIADALYTVLATSGDDGNLTDKIAQAYQKRMSSSADIVGAYENLFPTIWQYYEGHLQSEKRNQIASERIAGMSSAVQDLWQDLAKASSEATVVQQDLGSQSARVMSLEAALDHHSKMLAESNEHRDRYFADLGVANHQIGLVKQEMTQAEIFVQQELARFEAMVAAVKKDKIEAVAAVREERDKLIADVIAEKDRINSELIIQKDQITSDLADELHRTRSDAEQLAEIVESMRLSTSWRLTAPMRAMIRWTKRQ